MLKELFPGSTDFTVAIFKVPQISKHFSVMLKALRLSPQSLFILRKLPESNWIKNHLLFHYGYIILLFENLVIEATLFHLAKQSYWYLNFHSCK